MPAGAVAQVMQSGWKIGERVLRPALVGVSKGGAKAAPKEEPASPRNALTRSRASPAAASD